MTEELDTLEIAKAELMSASVPAPDDILTMLGPMGQLYFVQQVCLELGTAYATNLSVETDEGGDLQENGARALQAIMEAAGMLTHACVTMGLMPPEALNG
jgi:hypothetical protein